MVGMAAVTWEDLKTEIGSTKTDDSVFERLFAVAESYVDNQIGVQTVPEAVRNEAILNDGRELWKRRLNPAGSSQQVDSVGSPLPYRLSKDPHITTREILNPYLVVGF